MPFVELGGKPESARSGCVTEDFGRTATAELLAADRSPTAIIVSGTEVVAATTTAAPAHTTVGS